MITNPGPMHKAKFTISIYQLFEQPTVRYLMINKFNKLCMYTLYSHAYIEHSLNFIPLKLQNKLLHGCSASRSSSNYSGSCNKSFFDFFDFKSSFKLMTDCSSSYIIFSCSSKPSTYNIISDSYLSSSNLYFCTSFISSLL